MSSNAGNEDFLVGGYPLKNLCRCYDESFGIPFDVLLEVSDGHKVQELKAHKFVLALHSDVLEKKLRNSLNPTTPISLHCEDIEAMRVVIKFCYNIIDPLYNKPLRFLIAVYKEAYKLNIAELQVCLLGFPNLKIKIFHLTFRSWFFSTASSQAPPAVKSKCSKTLLTSHWRIKPCPDWLTLFFAKPGGSFLPGDSPTCT